jgi:hypothetical protein
MREDFLLTRKVDKTLHAGRSLRQVEKPDHRKDYFLKGSCECGRLHTAAFPAGVDAPAQYGATLAVTDAITNSDLLLN